VRPFISMYGFSAADFSVPYEPLDPRLSAGRRARPRDRLIDSFLLFVDSLHKGTSFEKIGAGFQLSPETLCKCLIEVAMAIREPIVDRFIKPHAPPSRPRHAIVKAWPFSSPPESVSTCTTLACSPIIFTRWSS
jgi:hypothetical protein